MSIVHVMSSPSKTLSENCKQCRMCHEDVQFEWGKRCLAVPKRYKDIWGFSHFNPIQTSIWLQFKRNSRFSCIVTTKTNTGKTAAMEMAIQRHLKKERMPSSNFKVLILEPLKALAREKVERLNKIFPELDAIEMTSDAKLGHGATRNKKLLSYDIIVCSYEMLDSMSRKPETYTILDKIKLFIVDEVHELGDRSRGADLDGAITRFLLHKKQIKKKVQVVALSATFDNPEVLLKYFKQFVPDIKAIRSDFSPIKVFVNPELKVYPPYQRVKGALANIPSLLQNGGEVLAMFLSVADTWKTANALNHTFGREIGNRKGILAKVHHADLSLDQRKKTEEEYRNRKHPDHFKVLISTPTLLAGVNLPCQSILLDISYFNQESFRKDVLPIQKIVQAAGRVGRLPYYKTGYVTYMSDVQVVRSAERELKLRNIVSGAILNKLDDILNVEINMGSIDREALSEWYKMTFSAHASHLTQMQVTKKFDNTLEWLSLHGYIQKVNDQLNGTQKGELSMKSKIRPYFLEHALKVLEETGWNEKRKVTKQKVKTKKEKAPIDADMILAVTEQLFTSTHSDIQMNDRKLDAVKKAMHYKWLHSGSVMHWEKRNDYSWIANMAQTLQQMTYPASYLLKNKRGLKVLRTMAVCYQKGIIPPGLVKLSKLLGKRHIQQIGNKRLILLHMNGYSYTNLKKGKIPRSFGLPTRLVSGTGPLEADVAEWDYASGKVFQVLPRGTLERIKKAFRRGA